MPRSFVLLIVDFLSFTATTILAVLSAMFVRYVAIGEPRPPVESDISRIAIVFSVALIILIFRSITLGHYTQFRPFWLELKEVLKTVLFIAAFDSFLLFAIGVQFSRLWFGFFLLYLCLAIPYGRERAKIWMMGRGTWFQPSFIIGTDSNAVRTANALNSDTSLGYEVCGFINVQKNGDAPREIEGKVVYNDLKEAQEKLGRTAQLVFAFETLQDMEHNRDLLNSTISSNSQVTVVPPSMGLPLFGASVVGIFRHDTALLKLQNRLADPTAQFIKRCVDIIFGSIFLLIFSPIFLALAFVIKQDGGPVFFNHTRIGKNGAMFSCRKFRSMKVNSAEILEDHLKNNPEARKVWSNKHKLQSDPRVTRIGHYLRRTSVDELPQLINVIVGEMSLVGPRPIVDEEVKKYGNLFSYYRTMKPGMTGLWQVSGRTDTTYEERVQLDVWYCKNWTLWNDAVVLFKTCKTLVNRHGAY